MQIDSVTLLINLSKLFCSATFMYSIISLECMGLTDVMQRKRSLIDYAEDTGDGSRVLYTSIWPKTHRMVPGAVSDDSSSVPSLPPRVGPLEYVPESSSSPLETVVGEPETATAELGGMVPASFAPTKYPSRIKYLNYIFRGAAASLAGSILMYSFDTSPDRLGHSQLVFILGIWGSQILAGIAAHTKTDPTQQIPNELSADQHPYRDSSRNS